MPERFIQLVILFFVIFDPPASFIVFTLAMKDATRKERFHTALIAVGLAFFISLIVLFFGPLILVLFNTSLDDLRVAGGMILCILGVKMALGQSITSLDALHNNSAKAVAAIIGTPLLTGPAAIVAIMINSQDFGRLLTGLAVLIVLSTTAVMFFMSEKLKLNRSATAVLTTILGLITIAWGVGFVREGLHAWLSSLGMP